MLVKRKSDAHLVLVQKYCNYALAYLVWLSFSMQDHFFIIYSHVYVQANIIIAYKITIASTRISGGFQ